MNNFKYDLSVIIVNYNVKEFLNNLIPSIHKAAANLKCEILIVDNASKDGSIEFLKDNFPEVKLFANKENLGFGKANNLALEAAQGKYLLILNPDTLLQEDTLEKMISFFENHPEAGMAGCKILNPDGTLQLACRRSFPGPWTSFTKVSGLSSLFPKSSLFARYNLTYLDENKTYEVDAISGSFMFMPAEMYKKVGGFDEQFFMYGEDLDLCYRVQKAGFKVYYVHNTQIIHYKGESTKRSGLDETKHFYNAMHLFVKKHLSSSFLVEIILQTAIFIRAILAFLGKRKTIIISTILDFIFFNASLLLAEKFYQGVTNWQGFNPEDLKYIFTIPALIHITTSAVLGVYKRNYISVLKIFPAIVASFFLVSSLTFFFKEFGYSRAVVLITYLLLFFLLSFWRALIKIFFKVGHTQVFANSKTCLIAGTSQNSINIAEKVSHSSSEFRIVKGFISDNPKDLGQAVNNFKVLGTFENIQKVIQEHNITEIIISPDEFPYNKIMELVAKCQNENIEFKVVGSKNDFLVGKTGITILEDISLISIEYNISKPIMKFLKRSFDIVFSILMFIFYPILILSPNKKLKEFIKKVPNVFKGKNSFVGPKNNVGNELLGKNGLTGFWYLDNFANLEEEKLNLIYAKNQNIWLDIEILSKTFKKILEP